MSYFTKPGSNEVRNRIRITLPPGAYVGYDPFEHPEDLQPVNDSFGQPVNPVDSRGHIIPPKKEGADQTGNQDNNNNEVDEVVHINVGDKGITEQEFYHGLLPREDINRMLTSSGDFLIRRTEIGGAGGGGHRQGAMEAVEHFLIRYRDNEFWLTEERGFPTVLALVNYHLLNKIPFGAPPVMLVKPVCRQQWEFRPEQVTLGRTLGQGAFGQVHLGRVNIPGQPSPLDVAVKTLKAAVLTKSKIEETMKEARLMRMLKHKNVVRCYGVSADEEPLLIIMEYVPGGSLDSFLRNRNIGIPVDDRVQMCLDAASGLMHVHRCGVLHRDIAARNCLYGRKTLKISDFGMSRQAATLRMDPSERAPVKTISPEVFRTQVYTPAADVWAYGVLVWEIFNNGQEPYMGWTSAQIKNEVINNNFRLNLPEWAPSQMKEILTSIFVADPADRATLDTVIKSIQAYNQRRLQQLQQRRKASQSALTAVLKTTVLSKESFLQSLRGRTRRLSTEVFERKKRGKSKTDLSRERFRKKRDD